MLILALEQSTPSAGICLQRDGAVIADYTWQEARKRDQHLFAALPNLLQEAHTQLEAVDRIAIGLGPGSYSGVRIALAAASALGLPDARPLAGISSAAALAWQTMETTQAHSVTVIGDARRKRLWIVRYERNGDTMTEAPELPLQLINVDTLRDHLTPDTCIVSSEWTRLKELLTPLTATGYRVIQESRYPSATAVATLASQMPASTLCPPLTPPAPLYLHPAVFAAPRFTPPTQRQ